MPSGCRVGVRRRNGHGRRGLSRCGSHRRLGARLEYACRIPSGAAVKSGTQTQPAQTQRTQHGRIGQAISENLFGSGLRIGHPHGCPIRPKPPRDAVSRRA